MKKRAALFSCTFRWQLLRFLPAVVERTVVNRQIQKDSAATFEEKKKEIHLR